MFPLFSGGTGCLGPPWTTPGKIGYSVHELSSVFVPSANECLKCESVYLSCCQED